jgi:hypothetical protein
MMLVSTFFPLIERPKLFRRIRANQIKTAPRARWPNRECVMPKAEDIGLTSRQVQNFIDDDFVKIEKAFSPDLAKQCRDELWADIGLSPDKPESWIQPVVRVGSKASPPFVEAANTLPRAAPTINSLVRIAGLRPKASEPFRSAFPHRNPLVTVAGTWT